MKEFMYVFQISKLITFEVEFYTLGTNSAPYFSTSANEFCFYDIVKLSKMEPKKKGVA